MSHFSFSKWRNCFVFAAMGSVLFALSDVGAVFNELKIVLSNEEEFLLLVTATCLGLVPAFFLSLFLCFFPIPDENISWSGFISGLLTMIFMDQFERRIDDPPAFVQEQSILSVLGVVVLSAAVAYIIYRPPKPKVKMAVVLLISFSMAGSLASISPKQESSEILDNAPSVMLITLDAARFDHFDTTAELFCCPFYKSLVEQGIVFTNAYTQIPVSGPAHAAILSGDGPWRSKVYDSTMKIPEQQVLLAEYFKELGYATGGFVGSSRLNSQQGFARGFETYDDDFFNVRGLNQTFWGRLYSRWFSPPIERIGSQTVDQAIRWLDTVEKPFFTWVQLNEPHGPYDPPPPWDKDYYSGDPYDPAHTTMPELSKLPEYQQEHLTQIKDKKWVEAQYKGELSTADVQLGRLMTWLEENDRADNTLLIFVGAYGENFGEDDVWFDHGSALNEQALHVPLVIRFPEIFRDVNNLSIVNELVELIDITPAIFELIGQDPLTEIEGKSFANIIYQGSGRAFTRATLLTASGLIASITNDEGLFVLPKDNDLLHSESAEMKAAQQVLGQ